MKSLRWLLGGLSLLLLLLPFPVLPRLAESAEIGKVSVAQIQQALKAAGYDPGLIDNIIGTKTQAAIKAFQEAKGLKPTGVADDKTIEKLSVKAEAKSEKIEASFESLSDNRAELFVLHKSKPVRLSVDKELQARLKNLKPDDVLLQKGNVLVLEVAEEKGEKVLKELSIKAAPVSLERRFRIFGASLLVLVVLSMVFVGWKPNNLLVGEDNRYSNSKFQVTIWFFVLIASYLSVFWLRLVEGGGPFIGGINIPQNLLLLSWISALTLGAAKGITTAKNQAAPAAEQKTRADAPKFLRDLSCNDNGGADIGDFQMVIVTLVAVVTYIIVVMNFLATVELFKVAALPDVDTTILATFGLGQGAYLTKKYAGKPREA